MATAAPRKGGSSRSATLARAKAPASKPPGRRGRVPKRGRSSEVERIVCVIRDLINGAVTVDELAERYGVNAKTIRRLLGEIGDRLPLTTELGDHRRKRYSIPTKSSVAGLTTVFDVSHYLALTLAMSEARASSATPKAQQALEDLADKVEKSLRPAERGRLRKLSAAIFPYGKLRYTRAVGEHFWVLLEAITEQRLCRVTYRAVATNQPKTYDVLPLRVFVHDGALYAHTYHPKHATYLPLHLHRLERLQPLDETVAPPEDYDPARYLDAGFGLFAEGPPVKFRLRFTAKVAPYLRERTWHSSQQLEDLPDGGVELTLTCAPSRDLFGWVAGWRQDVTVLEPAALRDHLREVGQWLLATYPPADAPRAAPRAPTGRPRVKR